MRSRESQASGSKGQTMTLLNGRACRGGARVLHMENISNLYIGSRATHACWCVPAPSGTVVFFFQNLHSKQTKNALHWTRTEAHCGGLSVCTARAPRLGSYSYCDSAVKQNGAGSNPLLAAPASVRIAAVPSARKPCDSPFGAVCGGWASGANAPRVLGSSNEYSNGLRAMVRS